MKMSQRGRDLLALWEGGYRTRAYQCSAGRWTISAGCTYYEDGTAVKRGDAITEEKAKALFPLVLAKFENTVSQSVKTNLKQSQFDALVSLCFNIGTTAFNESTVLKLVNKDPNDPAIRSAFMMWRMEGRKVSQGLINRRMKEITLYYED